MDRSNGLESAFAGETDPLAIEDASGREAAACRKRRRCKKPSRTDESDANKLSCGREVPAREQKSHWRAQICIARAIESGASSRWFRRHRLQCRPGFLDTCAT